LIGWSVITFPSGLGHVPWSQSVRPSRFRRGGTGAKAGQDRGNLWLRHGRRRRTM